MKIYLYPVPANMLHALRQARTVGVPQFWSPAAPDLYWPDPPKDHPALVKELRDVGDGEKPVGVYYEQELSLR